MLVFGGTLVPSSSRNHAVTVMCCSEEADRGEAMRAGPASGVDPGRNAVRERIDALRRREHAGPAFYLLAVAVAALAYYVAGRVGLELAYLNGAVAALWPPAGLGLAVLFLYGVRLWPAIVIGDLATRRLLHAAGDGARPDGR